MAAPTILQHLWLLAAVDTLTVARLVRIVQADHLPVVEPARLRSLRRNTDAPAARRLLWTCAWCLSPWIAVLVIGLHLAAYLLFGAPGAVGYALLEAPLAVSYVAAVAAENLEGR